ncbi:MAG: Cache 3/Cache 2 fusion domain-containing protein [Simplicispira sp.]|nr:Cache 3/Cache 2 fusion domain-containing protein [Simplicispira sp.]
MHASPSNNRSVARRITGLAIALVALVLVLVGTAISLLTERSTRAQVVQSVGDTTQSVANALAAADATNRELVQRTMKGFQRYFDTAMTLDDASGELRSFGALVNDDHGSVDRFANETGGVARVYVRKGEGFQSITSSVKDAQGGREPSTTIPAGPALTAVLAGQPWIGSV